MASRTPTEHRDDIKRSLLEFYTEDEAELWLRSHQRLLHGLTPDYLIAHGDPDAVRVLVEQLQTGAFV